MCVECIYQNDIALFTCVCLLVYVGRFRTGERTFALFLYFAVDFNVIVRSVFKFQFLVVLFLVNVGKVAFFVLFLVEGYKSYLAHFTPFYSEQFLCI